MPSPRTVDELLSADNAGQMVEVEALALLTYDPEPDNHTVDDSVIYAPPGYVVIGDDGQPITEDANGNALADLPSRFECPFEVAQRLSAQGLVRIV